MFNYSCQQLQVCGIMSPVYAHHAAPANNFGVN